jgi:hypothetical protein
LKKNYGGEFKCLRDFGLSISKEENREQGRSVARKLMLNDDSFMMDNGGETENNDHQDKIPMRVERTTTMTTMTTVKTTMRVKTIEMTFCANWKWIL